MRIGINCQSFVKKSQTGIGRYAYNLVKNLGAIDSRNEYSLYAKKGFFDFSKKVPKFDCRNFKFKFDRFNKGSAEVLKDVDVYHAPSPENLLSAKGSGATFIENKRTKVVITIHDLIYKTFPQGHTQITIDSSDKQLNEIVKRADKIICCSKSTSNDLKKFFQVPDERMSVIYHGVDKEIFRPITKDEEVYAQDLLKSNKITKPFILFVGTLEPRKNLKNVLYAFKKLKENKSFEGILVVIGMQGWLHEEVPLLLLNLDLVDDVVWLGYVKDTDLKYYYAKAKALVFPSFYEGFGFPIIEAFSSLCPVITSNISSCPEVAGDSAVLVNPSDTEEISSSMAKVINDTKFAEGLKEKGFQRAKEFEFKNTAENTLKVYEEVYNIGTP